MSTGRTHSTRAADRHAGLQACAGSPAATIDLRDIRLRDQRRDVFLAFRSLEVGQVLHLSSDQSLESIYFEFVVETPDDFHWQYLEVGPASWCANVTRLNAHPENAGWSASSGWGEW
jgi:uncharacterized protein (DUF2249 family)